MNEEKKVFESKIKSSQIRMMSLSTQVSNFENVVIIERKSFEEKNVEFQKKISELEKQIENERIYFERKKNIFEKAKNVEIFKEISKKRKTMEKDFETERSFFDIEIRNLTKKLSFLSELSIEILKEQNTKSDLQKKFNVLDERNKLSDKVKGLEDIRFNVNMFEQGSPDTINQSPYAGSTDFECSFKTASSSIHKSFFQECQSNQKIRFILLISFAILLWLV